MSCYLAFALVEFLLFSAWTIREIPFLEYIYIHILWKTVTCSGIPTLPHFWDFHSFFEGLKSSAHPTSLVSSIIIWKTTQAIPYAFTASLPLSHNSYWTWCGAEGSEGTLACAKHCEEPWKFLTWTFLFTSVLCKWLTECFLEFFGWH